MKKFLFTFCLVFVLSPAFSQTITVISPNGGENWMIGCPSTIQWITSSVTVPVKIELFKTTSSGLIYCMTICSMVPANTNSYSWIPPYSVAPASIYKVKVSALSNTAVFDFSNNNFSLVLGSITVISPNGGENWQVGTTHLVTWTDNICENVRIELWKGGAFYSLIASSVPSNGSFTWAITNSIPTGNNYKVKIMSLGLNAGTTSMVYDFSDNNFTISQGYYIIVTSPNGGEVWAKGTTHIITWLDNISWNVRIELWKGGIYHSLINASTPSTGSCYWAIPSTLPSGNNYKIKILALSSSNAALFDFSDNNFSIIGPTPSPSILPGKTIKIYPNPCGDLLHIQFKEEFDSKIEIEIYSMNGQLMIQQSINTATNPQTLDLNTSALNEGKYLVIIRKDKEILLQSNLVVSR
jgi:hypothetical protein